MTELFYTYIWKDANGVPFYVGKGRGKRAWHVYKRSFEFKAAYSQGGCTVEIVDEFIMESQAHAHEMQLIEQYGRREFGGLLVNKTDGGEGLTGMVHTAEAKAKISAANLGVKNARFGKALSAETKASIAAANIGKLQSVETKDKNRQSQLLRFKDPAERARLSEAHLKRWEDPSEREKQSRASKKGWENPFRHSKASADIRKRYEDQAEREKHAIALRLAPPHKGNTSGFKGVSWDKSRGKWFASLRIGKKQKNLGRYPTDVEAARAYDAACIEAFGLGNCYLNFPPPAANDNTPKPAAKAA